MTFQQILLAQLTFYLHVSLHPWVHPLMPRVSRLNLSMYTVLLEKTPHYLLGPALNATRSKSCAGNEPA